MKRRDFLRSGIIGCCGAALATSVSNSLFANNNLPEAQHRELLSAFYGFGDSDFKRFADIAIETAKSRNATYSDIRICKFRNQRISTREERVTGINDGENFGFGVRVIVNGSWGFASSYKISSDEIKKAVNIACDIATANSKLQIKPVTLAPVKTYVDEWKTPIVIDPFEVSIEDKIAKQLLNNKTAKDDGADFVDSFMWFVNEWKYFASSEGSYIKQDIYRMWAQTNVTLIDKQTGEFATRKTLSPPIARGYEQINEFGWEDEIRTAVENSKMKLKAPSVTPGTMDLILDQQNLWLTIHESCGHPSELDRALGFEANYAGTSFMTPEKLNNLKYGSDIVNLVADRTQKNGLASRGYDDDGAKTKEWHIIKDGKFVDYQTTRELASYIGQEESNACAYCDSWATFPIQRMPNISLMPGKNKLSFDELIADTEEAILVIGDGSWSIDQQRYNFQFTGQDFWHIKNGKKVGMLKDVAYQGNTIDFWNSCDAICDVSEYKLGGSFFCGKGEPSQVSPVSHGSSPARFRNVNILNTKEQI